jgi:hypothetical protein
MVLPNPWERLKQKAAELIPPVVVLREQAQLLTEATEGVIQGEVETSEAGGGGLRHDLVIRVPSMNNYKVVLLYAIHPAVLYPVNVDAPSRSAPAKRCNNKDELSQGVVDILSEDASQKLVTALLAQAVAR